MKNQFFKIIKDQKIIDVAMNGFICIDSKYHNPVYCDPNDAQFIKSAINEAIYYHINWLNNIPEYSDISYDIPDEIIVIEPDEYEELRGLLIDGQDINVQIIENVEDNLEEVQPIIEYQKPENLMELRQIISDQSRQIQLLTDALLELSGVMYDA